MNEFLTYMLDLFRMIPDLSLEMMVGVALSPAKFMGIVFGLYRFLSTDYVDPTWRNVWLNRDVYEAQSTENRQT